MKKTRLLAFLLTACLATTCFLSGTVAKYSSTASGTAEPTVAQWNFTVDSTNITDQASFTFGLFSSIDDTKEGNPGNQDNNVATGKIAPGTSGSVELVLTNTSEVTANYTVAFSINITEGNPLLFSTDGSEWKTAAEIAELNISATELKFGNATAEEKSDTITVYWKWLYENGEGATLTANDEIDVAFAKNHASDVVVTAIVTVEQVD